MKSIIGILIFFLQIAQLYAQQCGDSSVHMRYVSMPPYSDSLCIRKQIPAADGGRIAIGNYEFTQGAHIGVVIRFNKDGSLKWSRRIVSNPFESYPVFKTIAEASNGNIIITAHDGRTTPYILLVFSPQGDMIADKRWGLTNIPDLSNRAKDNPLIINYGTDSLMLVSWAHNEWTEGTKIILTTLDNYGNIGSTSILTSPLSTQLYYPFFSNGKIENGMLKIYGVSNFYGQCVINTIDQPALLAMEIDMVSKKIISKKAYCAPLNAVGNGFYDYPMDNSFDNYGNAFFQKNGNVVITRSYLQLESVAGSTINKLFSVSTFDADFNHLHSEYITTGNFMKERTIQEIVIDTHGARHLSFYDYKTQSAYYAVGDSNNHFFLQKKLPLVSEKKNRFFSRNSFIEPGYLTSFNVITFQNNLFQLDNFKILAKDTAAACFGADTSFLSYKQAQVSPINWQGQFDYQEGVLEIVPAHFFTVELPMQTNPVCIIRHFCDIIKIKGNTNHCMATPITTFTAYKNAECNQPINWIVDTAAIKIISQPNDTTLKVKFLKPYNGYIKARLQQCNLMDSLYINVNASMQALSLGADTMFCPGKTLTLNAGAGFKTYKWQDNSTASTFTVTQPGTYYVEATDSCANIFKDTILVKPLDEGLNVTYPNSICQSDTATIAISNKFFNYSWSPASQGIISADNLKLFPLATTQFSITAELFSGCILSDTALIKVVACNQYVYIPTAFTPNDDGNNDIFKPVVSGRLQQYQFAVYNRYAQRIFYTTDLSEGWKGKIKGITQSTGVYVWVCNYKFINKPAVSKKGTVVLIR
ncbi:T9SS type B sorting domain-containing protein [Ferruginibacter sp.]